MDLLSTAAVLESHVHLLGRVHLLRAVRVPHGELSLHTMMYSIVEGSSVSMGHMSLRCSTAARDAWAIGLVHRSQHTGAGRQTACQWLDFTK